MLGGIHKWVIEDSDFRGIGKCKDLKTRSPFIENENRRENWILKFEIKIEIIKKRKELESMCSWFLDEGFWVYKEIKHWNGKRKLCKRAIALAKDKITKKSKGFKRKHDGRKWIFPNQTETPF